MLFVAGKLEVTFEPRTTNDEQKKKEKSISEEEAAFPVLQLLLPLLAHQLLVITLLGRLKIQITPITNQQLFAHSGFAHVDKTSFSSSTSTFTSRSPFFG